MKAVEAVKVKLWCFKGIVHPTHFQKQVGWGTWLAPTVLFHLGFISFVFYHIASFLSADGKSDVMLKIYINNKYDNAHNYI